MGAVNTANSLYSNSHISLESINPLFDANTPIYLVVDEMKLDNADYDIDVTLSAPVSNFWKSYPENGKTHVEIRTKIDNDDKIVRTVTCIIHSKCLKVSHMHQLNWPGINFLCLSVCVCSILQSCRTLCDPMYWTSPGFSVHGILQVRIMEWTAIPFSRGSS